MNKLTCAVLVTSLAAARIASGAISFGAVETFTTIPTNWTTSSTDEWSSYVGAGNENTIPSVNGALTAAVNAVSHAALTNPGETTSTAGNSTINWLSRDDSFRINTANQNVQIALGESTTAAFSFFQGRARNTTGNLLNSVKLDFDMAWEEPGSETEDPMDYGLNIYYSIDPAGAAGSWIRIPEISTDVPGYFISSGFMEHFSATIDLSGVGGLAPNEHFFVRWVDDNTVGDDNQYTLDNIAFNAPEPSTAILAVTGCALAALRRHRRTAMTR